MALDLQEPRMERWCLECLLEYLAALGAWGFYICLGMGEWEDSSAMNLEG